MLIRAVLTGDLIHSQAVSNTKAFLARLEHLLAELDQQYGAKADTFRGDGFQTVMEQPQLALTYAVALRAGLIASSPEGERWDARVAVGIGTVSSESDSYGQAYVLSGQGLDDMKKSTLAVFSSDARLAEHLDLPTAFVESIIESWTQVEAQTYFLHVTQRFDHQGLANQLGKSRVTVTKALQRANARLLDRYLNSATGWIEALQHD